MQQVSISMIIINIFRMSRLRREKMKVLSKKMLKMKELTKISSPSDIKKESN
jgi:hypothetical protein